MHTGLLVDKAARDLLGVLLAELDDLEADRVPVLVDAILEPLLEESRRRAGRVGAGRQGEGGGGMDETASAGFLISLELLPKLVALTADVTALGQSPPVPELVRGLSGAQYKQRVVSRLFRARWPTSVAIGLCQTLRDMDLDERQLKVAVGRVLRHLRRRAELHDLPPLTYQLLLLAGRCVPFPPFPLPPLPPGPLAPAPIRSLIFVPCVPRPFPALLQEGGEGWPAWGRAC